MTFLPLPVIRPGTAVISGNSGLAVALAAGFERLGAPRPLGRIKEELTEGADRLGPLLDELSILAKRRLVAIDASMARPAIVVSIDQAEELFNADGATESSIFLELLAGVLVSSNTTRAPRILVIATIRSDRYELLQAEPHLAAVKQDLFNLPPIAPSEFKSVIEGPARRVVEFGGRIAIDPALTEQLITDAQGADALPLLAFTLERLHADYGSEGRLTIAEYEKIGGVQGSIEAAVNHALAEPGRSPAIPPEKKAQLACLRAAFIPWLARIDPETGAPMRRMARLDEIPESSRSMVERLVEARLLVADRRAGVDVIEVAHESLLRRWPALTTWLEADADDLRLVEGVERASSEWARNGRHVAWLDHRAERLAAADRLAARDDFRKRLGEEGTAYLAACRLREDADRKEREEALAREQARLAEMAATQERMAAAQARTAHVQRNTKWALAATAIAVAIGLGFGFWQRQTTNALRASLEEQRLALEGARVNLLAELATTERLGGSLDGALRLAAHGVRLDLSLNRRPIAASPASAALAVAIFQSRWRLILSGHTAELNTAAFSPDGSRIVTAAYDKTARIWNAVTGEEISVLKGHDAEVNCAAFSPDGLRIVTASWDKTARIWDATTGTVIAVLHGHDGQVSCVAFSPDGSLVVTASWDNTARIWEATQGTEIAVLRGHETHREFRRLQP